MLAADEGERAVVRRVLVVAVAVALASSPLAFLGLADRSWWLPTIQALGLTGILVGLLWGRSRLRTVTAVGVVGVHALALFGFVRSTSAWLAGESAGVGLGRGLLWAMAALAPISMIGLPLWRAVRLHLVALGTACVLALSVANGRLGEALVDRGLGIALVQAALLLGATSVVALHALRRENERAAAAGALLSARERFADVGDRRELRRGLFGTMAQELTIPLERLRHDVDELTRSLGEGAWPKAHVDRVLRVVNAMQERTGALLHRLRLDAEHARAAGVGDTTVTVLSPAAPRGAVLLTLAGGLALAGDLAVTGWVVHGDPSLASLASAANRMVFALVTVVALVGTTMRSRTSIIVAAVGIVSYPVTILALAAPGRRGDLLAAFGPAWRIAVVGAAVTALLAELVVVRARARDEHRAATQLARTLVDRIRRQQSVEEELSAQAVHELKNPLAVIRMTVDTLEQRGDQLPPAAVERLAVGLRDSVERLATRLATMRQEVGTGPAREPAQDARVRPVAELLLDAIAEARTGFGDATMDVDVQVSGAEVAVSAGDLNHVVENLVTNAVKYGDATRPVRAAARRADDEVVVTVTSSGGDLTPEQADQVFEAFYRSPSASVQAEGTGLGLAIVQRLVVGWGGRVWCDVADDQTVVGFTIPVASPVHEGVDDVVEHGEAS